MTVSRAVRFLAVTAVAAHLVACSDDPSSLRLDAGNDAADAATGDTENDTGEGSDASAGDVADTSTPDASSDVGTDATDAVSVDVETGTDVDRADASDAADTNDALDASDTASDADVADIPDVPECIPALEVTNGVDDDCDEEVDEEALAAAFRHSAGTVLVGPDLEVATASGYIRFEDRRTPAFGEGTVRLFGTDETIEGATATVSDGQLALSVPFEALDPLVLNPATLAVDLRVQLGDDTFVGSVRFELSVLPARVAVSAVDGVVYVSGPPSIKPRNGNSLYMGTTYDVRFGPEEEVEPGIWRMSGNASPDFSTAPNLFYFTTGSHTGTGAEAYFYDYGERQEEDGVVWWPADVGVEPAPRVYFFPEDALDAVLARDLEALP